MKNSVKIAAIVAALAVVAGGVGYDVLTSSAPATPCASAPPSSTYQTVAVAHPSPSTGAPGNRPLSGAEARDPGGLPRASPGSLTDPTAVIQVVAAENFWGSLVSQLGGNQTSVLSIVTNPNTDPHEYEANSSDAIAIADAQLVIVNGVGYDDWALQLIGAANNPDQIVLNVGDLNGVSVNGGIVSGNPHMWYNPPYVNRTVAAMFSDLVALRPAAASLFGTNYGTLNASLGALYGTGSQIRERFAGTEVASTESIFVYLANYTDLDLVSPPAFMQAVAEGYDPPAQSVVEFQCQLESGHVAVLVYNVQTVTPITSQMQALAAAHNVTVVGISETVQPPDALFQDWMGAEYVALENALAAQAVGH
ncbi:MAG: metal ABC transporter solute-binding protein, Zn/Mn family [Thermoplasmata archaeon]